MDDLRYSPTMLGILYTSIRAKYFASYTNQNFKTEKFEGLSLFLKKEEVDPSKYFDFVFGMLDYRKPLQPNKLANPELVQKFKNTVK